MTSAAEPAAPPLLARLAHLIVRRRRAVIVAWILLTIFGGFSAGQVSKRWFESFSIPGYSSYEANQRTLTNAPHNAARPAPVNTSSGLSQNGLPY